MIPLLQSKYLRKWSLTRTNSASTTVKRQMMIFQNAQKKKFSSLIRINTKCSLKTFKSSIVADTSSLASLIEGFSLTKKVGIQLHLNPSQSTLPLVCMILLIRIMNSPMKMKMNKQIKSTFLMHLAELAATPFNLPNAASVSVSIMTPAKSTS